jgi:hypothetical protein
MASASPAVWEKRNVEQPVNEQHIDFAGTKKTSQGCGACSSCRCCPREVEKRSTGLDVQTPAPSRPLSEDRAILSRKPARQALAFGSFASLLGLMALTAHAGDPMLLTSAPAFDLSVTDGVTGPRTALNPKRLNPAPTTLFHLSGAISGLSGQLFSTNSQIDYVVLGNFSYRNPGGTRRYSPDLIEGSITFNHLPHARVRVGQFQQLAGDDGLTAIQQYSSFNFSTPVQQLLLERIHEDYGADPVTRNLLPRVAGAFCDLGVQIFDTAKAGAWEHTYAAMMGNGGGIEDFDENRRPEITLYWSSEWLFGNEASTRDGLKFFTWGQWGERELTAAGSGYYSRTRWGLGTTLHQGLFRSTFEYIGALGMIYDATTSGSSANIQPTESAWGWSWDIAYRVHPKCELALRFDQLFSGTGSLNERRIDTLTLGAQVFLTRQVRALLNYELHQTAASNAAGGFDDYGGLDPYVGAQLAFSF